MRKLRRILLIENNLDDEALVREACRRANVPHEFVVAHDGDEALALIADDDAECPALVLLDLRLPGTSGFDVLKAMRADPGCAAVPVVVLSASEDQEDVAEAYRAGANSYLRKPNDFAALDEMLRVVLLYWLRINEEPPGTGGGVG